MRVAFLHDEVGYVGGAELTMQEFKAAAPDGVITEDREPADVVVIGNCVHYGPDLIRQLVGKRIAWYHNDLSPWLNPELKAWLDAKATHLFCSPLQQERYGLDGHLVPPALDLDRFQGNGGKGTVSIGAWRNPSKGQQGLWEWAKQNEPVDVYGNGDYAPTQPPLDFKGPLEPDEVPDVLHRYERFVHLPWDVEPFGRCVVEAWASGLDLVVNRNVGARYWLEQAPEKLESAAEDFWNVVVG